MNLALALAKVASTPEKKARVGLLDLDIFGPSSQSLSYPSIRVLIVLQYQS